MDRNALQNCLSAKVKKCKCSMSKLATYRTPAGDGYVYNPTAGMLGSGEYSLRENPPVLFLF